MFKFIFRHYVSVSSLLVCALTCTIFQYSEDEIKALRAKFISLKCSFESTDAQLQVVFDCFKKNFPTYLTNAVDNIIGPNSKCGEELFDSAGDGSELTALSLFCRNLRPTTDDDPNTISYKTFDCAANTYTIYYNNSKVDPDSLKCDDNSSDYK